jgi:signal transduction histidine kinase
MIKFRLRTKFLLSLLFITAGLTSATLAIVRQRVRQQAREEMSATLTNSLITFQNFQRQREAALSQSAALLANLPNLKALMTTEHAPTIQDASADFWRQIGSDLFVLADRTGKVVALHTSGPGLSPSEAAQALLRWSQNGRPSDWWFGSGHLYEVFLQPIYFGAASDDTLLGLLAVGYEVGPELAKQVRQLASSEVAFRYGDAFVVSTLLPELQVEMARRASPIRELRNQAPTDLWLGEEHYLARSVELGPGVNPSVDLIVMKSYDQTTKFLASINRLSLAVGIAAVLLGSFLVFLISDTFTRPLANLVAGVRALERGNFAYPLETRSHDETSELTHAFDRMRQNLEKTQAELLHAERLATMGRMASTISHDLRHPLTAILANAEFLSEGNLNEEQRRDFYQEIRQAVNRMTDLISSLLEFSRNRQALRPVRVNVEEVINRAIQTVRARPEFCRVPIHVSTEGASEGWFDPAKLERVFHNILLNACEAVPADSGEIRVMIRGAEDTLQISVADNGSGIPEPVRETVFQPFVSCGKANGTGLGLAIAQKIVQEHGGKISIERTGPTGTIFRLAFPCTKPDKVPSH